MIIKNGKFFKYSLIVFLSVFAIMRSFVYLISSTYVFMKVIGPQSVAFKKAFEKYGFNETILFLSIGIGVIVSIFYIITSINVIKLHNRSRINLLLLLLYSLIWQLTIDFVIVRRINYESITNYCFICLLLLIFTRRGIIKIFKS